MHPFGYLIRPMSSERVIIVDYQAGNVESVHRACGAVGIHAQISANPEEIRSADRIIFPGVGTAESAVLILERSGIKAALLDFAAMGKPLLGICLGAQILMQHTEEGDQDCLGLLPGECRRFNFDDPALKVPQIGWNEVHFKQNHPLLKGLASGLEFYFVHSYFVSCHDDRHVLGETTYGDRTFASIIGRDHLVATQFHLEKSGRFGLQLLKNFSEWDGTYAQ